MRLQDGAQAQVAFEGLAGLERETTAELVDCGDHEIVAPGEMQEDGAMRHVDRPRHVGSGGLRDAIAREQIDRGVDQALARGLFLFLSSGWLHRWYKWLSQNSLSTNSL